MIQTLASSEHDADGDVTADTTTVASAAVTPVVSDAFAAAAAAAARAQPVVRPSVTRPPRQTNSHTHSLQEMQAAIDAMRAQLQSDSLSPREVAASFQRVTSHLATLPPPTRPSREVAPHTRETLTMVTDWWNRVITTSAYSGSNSLRASLPPLLSGMRDLASLLSSRQEHQAAGQIGNLLGRINQLSKLPPGAWSTAQAVVDLSSLARAHADADVGHLDHTGLLARVADTMRTLFPRADSRAAQVVINTLAAPMHSLLECKLAADMDRLGVALVDLMGGMTRGADRDAAIDEFTAIMRDMHTHPYVHRLPLVNSIHEWERAIKKGVKLGKVSAAAAAAPPVPPHTNAAVTTPTPRVERQPARPASVAASPPYPVTQPLSANPDPDSLLRELQAAFDQSHTADESTHTDTHARATTSASAVAHTTPAVAAAAIAAAPAPSLYQLVDSKRIQLESELTAFYSSRRLVPYERGTRDVLLSRLQLLISTQVDPSLTAVVFGSSASGTATKGSDMDVAIMTRGGGTMEPTKAVLRRMERAIRASQQFINIQPILRARVPIIKVVDRQTGLHVDLAFGQASTQHKSNLMAAYSRADPRVAPLLTFVKAWASSHDLNDAARHTLNSFGYALLVVQYLQVVRPAVLTSLQTQGVGVAPVPSTLVTDFVPNVELADPQLPAFLALPEEMRYFVRDTPAATASDANDSTLPPLADLLVGFFRFYGDWFNAARMAVCVRTGTLCVKSPLHHHITRVKGAKAATELILVDPFDPTDNVARGISPDVWRRIQAAMRQAAAGLVATGRFEDILGRKEQAKQQQQRERGRQNPQPKQQRRPQPPSDPLHSLSSLGSALPTTAAPDIADFAQPTVPPQRAKRTGKPRPSFQQVMQQRDQLASSRRAATSDGQPRAPNRTNAEAVLA